MKKRTTDNKNPATNKPAAGNHTVNKSKHKSEFRYPKKRPDDTQQSHPHYIYKKQGHDLFGLEITHDSSGSNRSKTKGLEKNPNPKDNRPARIKKKAKIKSEKDFGPRLKGWKFWTKKDQDTVNELIKKNNQKTS